MFVRYLEKTGLENILGDQEVTVNNFVELAFGESLPATLLDDEIEKLYKYDVPKIGENGACSIKHEKEEKPYNLSLILERGEAQNLFLWRLNQIVENLQKLTGVDWVGIYKKVKNVNGEWVLLKLAYRGAFSRAEFPLTEEFAEHSNNSTVGLTGKAVLVQDVANYVGPYYQCDAKVLSEFCCPILNVHGEVVGIIDAESFKSEFFDRQKLLEIVKVCMDLGNMGF